MVDRASAWPGCRASSARHSMPIARLAGAGSMTSTGIGVADLAAGPAGRGRRRRAGSRRTRPPRPWPAGFRHCRGSARSRGRAAARSNCAARRGDEVPTRAPLGKCVDRIGADQPVADVGARPAPRRSPGSPGRSLSTSFIEWTEKSVSPASSARSSSLVHSALPPISASGRSCDPVAAGRDRDDRDIARRSSDARPRAPRRPCAPAPAPAASRAFRGSGSCPWPRP